MTSAHEHSPAADRYRPQDACLVRTADELDFGAATPEEAAAVAQRRMDPLGAVLVGLLRGLRRERRG